MRRIFAYASALLLVAGAVHAGEPKADVPEAKEEGDKVVGGMSIVGNDEAPKSLAIVPWKDSKLGDALDVSRDLDNGRQPVDKDVFMRELNYYQIRSGTR